MRPAAALALLLSLMMNTIGTETHIFPSRYNSVQEYAAYANLKARSASLESKAASIAGLTPEPSPLQPALTCPFRPR